MTVLKARVGADWVTIGGAAAGVPAGGTTGLVLTKKSAADYDTQWATNTPILANNTFLQGYRADGTTAQSLIGMTAADHVLIGQGLASGKSVFFPNDRSVQQFRSDGTTPQHLLSCGNDNVLHIAYGPVADVYISQNLAAGKNIYVPRLTVQGNLTLTAGNWIVDTFGRTLLWAHTDGYAYVGYNANLKFNSSSGSSYFDSYVTVAQSLTVTGTIYKGAVAYVHPDFVFEHHFTGGIERFRDAPGAESYEGLWPLARVEEFAQEHWRLPGHAARENDRVDIFRRTHDLLAELERVYLHLFEHERRLTELEER